MCSFRAERQVGWHFEIQTFRSNRTSFE